MSVNCPDSIVLTLHASEHAGPTVVTLSGCAGLSDS